MVSYLNEKGISFECVFTEFPSHAISLAMDAIYNGHRKLVAVGGDGTVHEVVNGICQQTRVPTSEIHFAVIPMGTGNDWARMYKIPTHFKKAIDLLVSPTFFVQDVGKVVFSKNGKRHERFFNNEVSVAFAPYIVQQSGDSSKSGLKGQLFYFWGIFLHLWSFKNKALQMKSGTFTKEGIAILGVAAIGKYSGGGMQLTPKAIPNDGQFDFSFVGNLSPIQVLLNILKLFNGKIYNHPLGFHGRGTHLSLTGDPDTLIEADGELLGELPAQLELIPSALTVVVGKPPKLS